MSDENPANQAMQTDVVLVVKGAGGQKKDVHFRTFLDGFLKAVRKYDPFAEVLIGPETKILADCDYNPYFKEFEQEVAEIIVQPHSETGDDPLPRRRIWVKEAYWEPRLTPPGSLNSLLREWRLTSYALIKLLELFFFPWREGKRHDADGSQTKDLNAHRHTLRGYFLYYFIATLLVLGMVGLTGLLGQPLLNIAPTIGRGESGLLSAMSPPAVQALVLLAIAVVTAAVPALQAVRHRKTQRDTGQLPTMPALPGWMLAALILAFIFQPAAYLTWLLAYGVLVLGSNLLARSLAWRFRADWYTDAPLIDYFEIEPDHEYFDQQRNRLALGTQLIYRAFVVASLPLAIVLLLLSKLARVLNLFGDLGTRIETQLNTLIVQSLGDVTSYALDPVQAAQVQNVLIYDVETFSNFDPVSRLHIFAHSQGTPISFEVLFHMLEPEQVKKVDTLITIGSVLNLHHLVNEALDETFWHRFPPEAYPDLNRSFKWFNFWNFTDPITQFTGLEAYRQDKLMRYKDKSKSETFGKMRTYEDLRPRLDYDTGSPFSIKTRDSLRANHGEYWRNIDTVQYPFLERILRQGSGVWLPDNWASDSITFRQKNASIDRSVWNLSLFDPDSFRRRFIRHRWIFALIWAAILALEGGLIWAVSVGLGPIGVAKDVLVRVGLNLQAWLGLWQSDREAAVSAMTAEVGRLYNNQVVIDLLLLALVVGAAISLLKVLINRSDRKPAPIIAFDPEAVVARLKEKKKQREAE
jgi:hypothetical protein